MTAPIASTPGVSAPATTTGPMGAPTTAIGKAALNENDFLQMLVAQMKNQDPMSPMQGTEFATQLAQFSSVEQLISMNSKLDAQSAAATQSANVTYGSSMVGRDVIVPGNGIDVGAGEMPQVTVDLPSAASTLSIEVIDSAGKSVGKQDFTNTGSGRQTFSLDQITLDPGQYTYKASAKAGDGSSIIGTSYSTARVQGISLTGGEIQVRIDGTMVPVSQVIEIISPAAAPVKPTSTSTSSTTTTTTGAPTP